MLTYSSETKMQIIVVQFSTDSLSILPRLLESPVIILTDRFNSRGSFVFFLLLRGIEFLYLPLQIVLPCIRHYTVPHIQHIVQFIREDNPSFKELLQLKSQHN